MEFDEEMVEEFKVEALDMLEEGEEKLLNLDRGGEFESNYNSVFRLFHSLKGGAGMLGLEALQKHTHYLENLLEGCKESSTIPKEYIDYFLKGIDASRDLLDGKSINFDYAVPSVSEGDSVESKKVTKTEKNKILIYVVDDEPDIREILTDMVEECGYEVQSFADGQLALNALQACGKEQLPSTMLVDMTMPNMTGLELLKHVQKIDSFLPLIFVSGNLTKANLIEAIHHGVFSIIEKPFLPNQIHGHIHNAVKRYELTRLLNRTIKFMMYQFSDLDSFLKEQGKEDIRATLESEIKTLIIKKRELQGINEGSRASEADE